ncbi:MAG: MBOAT family protein [Pseudomonadota bacterium]
MVFSSTTFLFVFLPLFLAAYALLPWRNGVALAFSLLFYAWGEGVYLLLLLGTIAANHLFGVLIDSRSWRKLALGIGVAVNLTLLAYFKYFGFLVADVLQLPIPAEDIPHLPLGISFFIFQSISYLVDVYRGDARRADSAFDLALYISMFPQLVAGPIVRYASVSDAIREREIHFDDVKSGIGLFIGGLCYKTLLANNVAEVADAAFAVPLDQLDVMTAWVGTIAYTLQIFFDFAGYSLMAIGIGRVMGFEFPQNFNYPYVSKSITEFWRRWHMSLSSWFRDYLYIPLGGNRKGTLRTYVNLFAVFFLCGLWHGASWTFVVWGMFHGLVLVAERAGVGRILARSPALLAHAYTLLLVMIGWVLFRAETFEQAWRFLVVMFTGGDVPALPLAQLSTNENLFYALLGFFLATPVLGRWLGRLGDLQSAGRWLGARAAAMYSLAFVAFAFCAIYVMAGTYNPFIYFRF